MVEASQTSARPIRRPASPSRRGPATPPGATSWLATLFVLALLGLGIILALWAPWQGEPQPATSGGRAGATAVVKPAADRPVIVSTMTGPAAPPPAPVSDMAPEGLPIRRSDWLILRDYQAHGGAGPNGAIAIGVLGNREAVGTPVFATHDGTVRVLKDSRRYGNLVAVKNSRWSTTYGFLDRTLVTDGQVVRRGDQVGTLGQSGTAAGPRLDYQVWEKVNGVETNRNPMDFLSSR